VVLSMGTDLMLIAIRLIQHRRRQKYAGGTARQIYTSLMIIFIEASCLSTAVKIAYAITFNNVRISVPALTGAAPSTLHYATQSLIVPCAVSG